MIFPLAVEGLKATGERGVLCLRIRIFEQKDRLLIAPKMDEQVDLLKDGSTVKWAEFDRFFRCRERLRVAIREFQNAGMLHVNP